jgi:hypothetical protein
MGNLLVAFLQASGKETGRYHKTLFQAQLQSLGALPAQH